MERERERERDVPSSSDSFFFSHQRPPPLPHPHPPTTAHHSSSDLSFQRRPVRAYFRLFKSHGSEIDNAFRDHCYQNSDVRERL